jgi:triacylglycerol lipase
MNHSSDRHRVPVFLVHGITDTHRKMRPLQEAIEKQGRVAHAIDLHPNNGSVRLEELARQLQYFIHDRSGDRPFDLIGFSMGGLVARYYVQKLGGIDRVQKFITISTPHRGTIAAYFAAGDGCEQMRPHSQFLQELNREKSTLDRCDYTAIWTPFDLIILPADSSKLGIGREISLPILAHFLMVSDRQAVNTVMEILVR